jgi:hypothetical protein
MEGPWLVTCAYCGTMVKGERTRLFWNGGTYRICSVDRVCKRNAAKRLVMLQFAFNEQGGRGIEMAEEIDRLQAWINGRFE